MPWRALPCLALNGFALLGLVRFILFLSRHVGVRSTRPVRSSRVRSAIFLTPGGTPRFQLPPKKRDPLSGPSVAVVRRGDCVWGHPVTATKHRILDIFASRGQWRPREGSASVANHTLSVALHYMHYNFCRIHKTFRVTPAMAAGVTDKLCRSRISWH
jgi:hypothetical protein